MSPLALSDFALVTSLGAGQQATIDALRAGRSGLAPCEFDTLPIDAYAGEVPNLDTPLTGAWSAFDCRNNRLAALALAQDGFPEIVAAAKTRYGAARIGVFLGTSTSGILHTEARLPPAICRQALTTPAPITPTLWPISSAIFCVSKAPLSLFPPPAPPPQKSSPVLRA